DGRYAEQAERQARGVELAISTDPPIKVLAAAMRERGYGAIAAETTSVTWAQYRDLAEIIGDARLRPEKGLVESIRAVKEDSEVDALRRSEMLLDDVFADLLGWISPGMTERDTAARINYEMQRRGAAGPAFETIVASGHRGSLPHGIASEKPIAEG